MERQIFINPDKDMKPQSVLLILLLVVVALPLRAADTFVSFTPTPDGMALFTPQHKQFAVCLAEDEHKGVHLALDNLLADFQKVSGVKPAAAYTPGPSVKIIVGSADRSPLVRQLIKENLLDGQLLEGKREAYAITTLHAPLEGIEGDVLLIAGSDKRGTIYGIYELSEQIGVSPWYWWADVPVEAQEAVYVKKGLYTDGEPKVKYRGIFLNDEWPCLGNWANKTFGGFNSRFYEKVFELVLRLKGNFMWPAMWGSAFYDDDPENGALADEMGIVMGTSHHEPMALAQQDWKRRGKGAWDYAANGEELRRFWTQGIERCKDWETVVTVGMRGDGDEAMSEDTNIALLQKIVRDQRNIIRKVTGKKPQEMPQVWALYKEVQDYYDQGMRVPDDVTLLLCDDNWGNVRRLPALDAKPRKGGYGMYYHFDYVGAPRNSKWINITQIQRVWEQMSLTYAHGVRELWVVNVGDLKPMEYPIDFFMDMAWNPARFNEKNLMQHTEDFCAQQFGGKYAREAARLIQTYTKYNRRITPELLDEKTYSLENYGEWKRVKDDYAALCLDALKLYYLMPETRRDAFDQLVLFPIQACANLYEMYYAVAMNRELASRQDTEANRWADKALECFRRDSVLTCHYHHVMSQGKWEHLMSQTHIGYQSWNEPERNVMPEVVRVAAPETPVPYVFRETDGYVSMEAEHYTRSSGGGSASWITIPGMGRTLSAVTTSPCTVTPGPDMYLEYDFKASSKGEVAVYLRFSPTLNYNDYKGLRYAVSIDGGEEQVVNINGDYRGELGQWQAGHVITTRTVHVLKEQGTHTLRIRPLDPALVLQKIIIDCGGLKPSYLGAPESL